MSERKLFSILGSRTLKRTVFLIVIPLLAICVGLYLYAAGGRYVSTDNAYVKANVIIISPEVRILGIDWKGKEYTGHDIGLRVHFNSRGHSWSTRELRKRVYNAERSKDDFR